MMCNCLGTNNNIKTELPLYSKINSVIAFFLILCPIALFWLQTCDLILLVSKVGKSLVTSNCLPGIVCVNFWITGRNHLGEC